MAVPPVTAVTHISSWPTQAVSQAAQRGFGVDALHRQLDGPVKDLTVQMPCPLDDLARQPQVVVDHALQ